MSEGFEIPGWPGGDYAGPKPVIPAGAELLAGGLCFIRRDGPVLLATANILMALKPWQRIRHHMWIRGRWCCVSNHTLIVDFPDSKRQELLMLSDRAVLVRPDGTIMELGLHTLRVPKTEVRKSTRKKLTVEDTCPPIILPVPVPVPIPAAAPQLLSSRVVGSSGWGNGGKDIEVSGSW